MVWGVALGGGGARGLAHAGFLLALEEAGLAPQVVAGTSMGAVVGGLYAAGQDLERLCRVLGALDLREIFGVPESYRRALERSIGEALWERLRGPSWREEPSPRLARMLELLRLFGKGLTIEQLKLRFAAVACDLHTGEEVIINRGPLYVGLAASAALPGVFHPLPWQGRWLIDGGVVNNLPADVALALGARVVVAVDVAAPLGNPPRTTVEVILRSYAITAQELTRVKLARVREKLGPRLLHVRPSVEGIGVLEFERLFQAKEAGWIAARRLLPQLRELLEPSAPRT
ncbi:MAG TPA: patatin-like phospholipase family protein [Candidatus Acetothermia bacterium]|nr:patatin-like phospholipase family protein [Candidatus Acetothermia bacterium]